MRAHRILFVQGNIANNVAFKDAVFFRIGKGHLVLGGVVDIHPVEDRKFGDEWVLRIDRECHTVVARARTAEAAEIKAARIVGLR